MQKINFNENWEYTNIDTPTNKDLGHSMTLFTPVQLPHDYTTDHPFDKENPSNHQGGYVRTGTLWYRKHFQIAKDACDTPTFLLFEGAYSNATIYINGQEAYRRAYGYISFCVDITPYLQAGMNLVAVHLDGTKEPSTRWFNGQGITRNVWLMQGADAYFVNDGVYVKPTNITPAQCDVAVSTTIATGTGGSAGQTVQAKIALQDASGAIVAETFSNHTLALGKTTTTQTLTLTNPMLWQLDAPHLYQCIVTLYTADGSELDGCTVPFGVRTTEFRPNEGFFLNGKHTLFKGVCMHHDGGCVGAAVPKALWKKRILQLKEMGCNAIRTSHNPFDPDFYTLCDALGMMVMNEIFDGWDIPKVKFGYGTIWEECHAQDLTDFVLRDRNHPCVMLWSLGNEVLAMDTEITKELMGIIRNLDDTRKISAGVQSTHAVSNANRALLDVAGYNDGGGACFIYELDHEKRPEQLFIATEAPHSFQTRGFYRTLTWWRDKNQPRKEIENLTEEEIFFDQSQHYNSSYDNSGVRTCARDSWSLVEQLPYLCGEFRWTGYDYVGEAFPYTWPSKTHSFGVIDSANFPKDHFYLYQSMWKAEKMLHILPHWTHPTMPLDTKVPVWVYTNCDEVELFLNGNSCGKQTKGNAKNLEWLVPYTPGKLVAKGYENGVQVLTSSIQTASTPQLATLSLDVLPEEGSTTLAQLTFALQDAAHIATPNANNITGIALPSTVQLLGSDNGAIDDLSHFKSSQRKAFNGLGMYLLRYAADDESATATLGALLGDHYFDTETVITLSAQTVHLANGEITNADCEIYYTLDGSTPTAQSNAYTMPFSIAQTTQVKIAIYQNGMPTLTLQDVFIKGQAEPVIDLNHLNFEVETERPTGPFAEQIIGKWECGGCDYHFAADGTVHRTLGSVESKIGYWWYDFPSDFLETPDYAGSGELWLVSGDRAPLTLTNQKAEQLCIDNSKNPLGNIVVNVNDIILTKAAEQ